LHRATDYAGQFPQERIIMSEEHTGEVAASQNGALDRPSRKLAEYLRARAEMEAPIVAQELSEQQMDKILTAETPEELDEAMQLAGLIGLRDLENGTEIQINGFHVALGTRSEFMNQLGVFAVINCQDLSTGQEFNVDTGVQRVIAFLRMCEHFERFPLAVTVTKVAAGGGELITLLPLRKRAVQGQSE
jgi:hypothetical protein